ncbi:hypothetical protein [Streptomyces sp. NPDC002640]
MSNDVACPVFRTSCPVVALSVACCLVEFGRWEYSKVSAYAEMQSVAEVRRMARAMTEGWFSGAFELEEVEGVPFEDQPPLAVGVPASGLPTEAAALEGRLPVEWEVLDLPIGSIEDSFTAAIGPNAGWINWDSLQWPDAPEAGFQGECKTR